MPKSMTEVMPKLKPVPVPMLGRRAGADTGPDVGLAERNPAPVVDSDPRSRLELAELTYLPTAAPPFAHLAPRLVDRPCR